MFLQPSYWCGSGKKAGDDPLLADAGSSINGGLFERDPVGIAAGVRIHNLRKVCVFHICIILIILLPKYEEIS